MAAEHESSQDEEEDLDKRRNALLDAEARKLWSAVKL